MNRVVLAAALAVLAGEALGQVQVIPIPADIATIRRISGDGNVVVGAGGGRARVWDRAAGTVFTIPATAGISSSTGSDVSTDGSVVVGTCAGPAGQTGFRWVRGVGVEVLSGQAGQQRMFAGNTVSGNGLVAGGDVPNSPNRAALRVGTGTEQLIGTAETGQTRHVEQLSYDGSVAAGILTSSLAFLWRDGEGCRLIPAPDGLAHAYKLSLTSIGDAVYGMAGSAQPGMAVPFLWSEETGTTVIPDLPDYDLTIEAANEDGRLAVGRGRSLTGGPNAATIHTFGVGTMTLADYLALFGASYQPADFGRATGISDDGSVIMGEGGLYPNWVVVIPPLGLADFNADVMTDFNDLSDFLDCFEGLGPLPVSSADLNRDGITDFFDLIEFYDRFGG